MLPHVRPSRAATPLLLPMLLALALPACACDDSAEAPGAGVLQAFGLGGEPTHQAASAASAASSFDTCVVFQDSPPWTHNPENPLVTDPWPNLLMDCFNAAKLAGRTHLWTTAFGDDPGLVGFYEAVAGDGVHFGNMSASPVFPLGATGAFDHGGLQCPDLMEDGALWRLWYTGGGGGVGGGGNPGSGIGYATSTNEGQTWARRVRPVLEATRAGWDRNGVATASVVRWHGQFWMYYATIQDPPAPGDPDPGPYHTEVGLATSPTGEPPWTKHPQNPVLSYGPPGAFDFAGAFRPRVTAIGDTLHLFYTGLGANNRCLKIGHAISTDGIHWTKLLAGLPTLDKEGPGDWDSGNVWCSSQVVEPDTLRMYYTGAGGLGNDHGFGLVQRPLATLASAAIGDEPQEAAPSLDFLSAWPNPANGRVVLRYRVAAGGGEPGRLAVYDVLGRRVAVVAEGVLGGGMREIAWEATGPAGERLPAGEYLVQLTTPSGGSAARVVLLP